MDEQVYQQQVNQQQIGVTVPNEEEPKQGLAITSFVLSLVGFNLLGLIFGIIALKKKQLRWAALAGTIISAAKLVITIFLLMGIFAGAILPRLGVAQQRARDIARENDLLQIGTAIVSYNVNHKEFPKAQNGCIEDVMDSLIGGGYLKNTVSDPLLYPFQPGLFCSSENGGYGYWTNGTNFAISASMEYVGYTNLCTTANRDYVNDFKEALNQNNIDSAREILNTAGDYCNATGVLNTYYVILY